MFADVIVFSLTVLTCEAWRRYRIREVHRPRAIHLISSAPEDRDRLIGHDPDGPIWMPTPAPPTSRLA